MRIENADTGYLIPGTLRNCTTYSTDKKTGTLKAGFLFVRREGRAHCTTIKNPIL